MKYVMYMCQQWQLALTREMSTIAIVISVLLSQTVLSEQEHSRSGKRKQFWSEKYGTKHHKQWLMNANPRLMSSKEMISYIKLLQKYQRG